MCDPSLYQDWTFLHNGHEVTIRDFPNKYEAADEFRRLYGYYPNINAVQAQPTHHHPSN